MTRLAAWLAPLALTACMVAIDAGGQATDQRSALEPGEREVVDTVLEIGERLVLSTEGIERLSYSGPPIVDLQIGEDAITVEGLRRGVFRVVVFREGRVVIWRFLVGGAEPSESRPPIPEHELELTVGEASRIPAGGVTFFSDGPPGVVSVEPSAEELTVTGAAPGEARLVLYDERSAIVVYRIVVAADEVDRHADERPEPVEKPTTSPTSDRLVRLRPHR